MDRKKARKKATELVSQMTLEEKASQLRYDAPAIELASPPTTGGMKRSTELPSTGQATISAGNWTWRHF